MEILDELVSACRRKHLRYGGHGVLRGGFLRLPKMAFSPQTGSVGNRLKEISRIFDVNKTLIRLHKPRTLPHEFIRLEPWEIEYLFGLARSAIQGVVETGRFRGGSTIVLSAGAPSLPIWSIDIAPQDDSTLKHFMKLLHVGENVSLIIGDSTLDNHEVRDFDLLWIDGDHSLAGCSADIRQWWPRLSPGGNMVLHDCYLGSEVMEAVSNFLRHSSDAEMQFGSVNTRSHHRSPTGSLCLIRKLPSR